MREQNSPPNTGKEDNNQHWQVGYSERNKSGFVFVFWLQKVVSHLSNPGRYCKKKKKWQQNVLPAVAFLSIATEQCGLTLTKTISVRSDASLTGNNVVNWLLAPCESAKKKHETAVQKGVSVNVWACVRLNGATVTQADISIQFYFIKHMHDRVKVLQAAQIIIFLHGIDRDCSFLNLVFGKQHK